MTRLPTALLAAAALAGCGSMPSPGDDVAVTVRGVLVPADLQGPKGALLRQNLAAAGIGEAEIAAGRVLRVDCAVMTDGWWASLALVAEGLERPPGAALRVRVTDPGNNDRIGVNRVTGVLPGENASGRQAYRFVPDWKERGMWNNFEQVPLPPDLAARHGIVQGSYKIKCGAGR